MKRIALYFVLPCLVMAIVSACSNEELGTIQTEETGKFVITAKFSQEAQTRASVEYDAFIPKASTRIAYDDSKVGTVDPALTWQEGDMLEVSYFDDNRAFRQICYTLLPEDAGKTGGRFTGDESIGTSYNNQYTVSYVAPAGVSDAQQGDDNTSHLRYSFSRMIRAEGVTDWRQVELTPFCGIAKIVLTDLPEDVGTLKNVTWKMNQPGTDWRAASYEIKNIIIDKQKTSCTLYMAIPIYKVEAGGNVQIILEGDKTYTATKVLTSGMSYEAGKRYTATIDNTDQTAKWEGEPVVVPVFTATLPDGTAESFEGLTMKVGGWDGNGALVEVAEATIAGGKAEFNNVSMAGYRDRQIWICVQGVVKYFHVLNASEAESNAVTLPDKNAGSTLLSTDDSQNDWQVALYMGINKDNSSASESKPLYWASGNLIAVKTSIGYAFHVATNEEALLEDDLGSDPFTPSGIVVKATTGYADCAVGVKWNKFGWGDNTGLKTATGNNVYGTADNICGTPSDIATKQLQYSWRMATKEEFAFNGSVPSVPTYTPTQYPCAITYTYSISNNGQTITNTLFFPGTHFRDGNSCSLGGVKEKLLNYWTGDKGYYWLYNSNLENNPYIANTANLYYGYAIRPVTE